MLYPAEWSNLCPAIQIDERDKLAELERKLQVLRFQMLTGFKKDGQSIAELQNSTLSIRPVVNVTNITNNEITNITNNFITNNVTNVTNVTKVAASGVTRTLRPMPSVGRAFIAGGQRSQIHGQIEKLTHLTERISVLRRKLDTPRHRHGGSCSAAKAYWAGGRGTSTQLSSVETLALESEWIVDLTINLASARVYLQGTYSRNHAYWCGATSSGYPAGAANGRIEKMNFWGPEVVSSVSNHFSRTIGGGSMVQNASQAYLGSGWNMVRFIDKLSFSNDTTSQVADQLSLPRLEGGSFASQRLGYWVGGVSSRAGNPWTFSRTVDAIRFNNDTVYLVSRSLSRRDGLASNGTSALAAGFWFGSVRGTGTWIETMDYASERLSLLSATLQRGGRYPVSAGRP